MTTLTLSQLVSHDFDQTPLWTSQYKIPWDSQEFSSRMLREHLSQEHDLASRRTELMHGQTEWICERFLSSGSCTVLDLACGPGLYAPFITSHGHRYLGLDFGPASIAHARKHFGHPGRCDFVLGNILDTPYGGPHDLAMLLYGEFNVFPPRDAARILRHTHQSLAPEGCLLLEVHTESAVRTLGRGTSWHTASAGLFGDQPYACLVRNSWFPEEHVARQHFIIIDVATSEAEIFTSTTQAWSPDGYVELLQHAGFHDIQFHADWPGQREEFISISARR